MSARYQIRRQDIGRKTLIIVGTLARYGWKIPADAKCMLHHEDFEPHFVGVTDPDCRLERIGEKDLQENGLRHEDIGKIKASFANCWRCINR